MEIVHLGKRAQASMERDPGIVTSYLHQAGNLNLPLLSGGAKGVQNPISKVLIGSSPQEYGRSSSIRVFLGPGKTGHLVLTGNTEGSPALCSLYW